MTNLLQETIEKSHPWTITHRRCLSFEIADEHRKKAINQGKEARVIRRPNGTFDVKER